MAAGLATASPQPPARGGAGLDGRADAQEETVTDTTKPGKIRYQGVIYIVERIRIEDLPEHRQASGMKPAAVQPKWLAGFWPPAILYEKEEEHDA